MFANYLKRFSQQCSKTHNSNIDANIKIKTFKHMKNIGTSENNSL